MRPRHILDADFLKGGPGSGYHGHAGRPGERGGSAPSGTGPSTSVTVQTTPSVKSAIEAAATQMRARWPGALREFREVKGDHMADIMNSLGRKDRWNVYLNERITNDPVALEANMKEWKGLRVTPDPLTPESYIATVVTHEMGHIAENAMLSGHTDAYRTRLEPLMQAAEKTGFLGDYFVSYYGQEHSSEWVAEALTDAMVSKNPKPISLQVASIFDDVFGKK